MKNIKISLTAKKNDTLKQGGSLIVNTIKVLTIPYVVLFLSGCVDGYMYKKPDNKLKPSPCACNGVVYDSRVVS